MPVDDLTWIADQLEIRNLIAQLAHAMDLESLDVYRECWTTDAVWEPPASPVHIPGGAKHGIEEIVEGAAARRAGGHQGPGTNTKHVASTTALKREGTDVVLARTYYTAYAQTYDAPVIVSVGHWDDVFTRTDDGWRLSRRTASRG